MGKAIHFVSNILIVSEDCWSLTALNFGRFALYLVPLLGGEG